jgi:hypothetical protein
MSTSVLSDLASVLTNALKIALVLSATLGLAGCKDINDGLNILQGKPTTDDAALATPEPVTPTPVEDEHSPELMYLPARGLGEYGERYATGWGCTAIPLVRICV